MSDIFYKLRVPDEIATLLRRLHPNLKKKIRSALKIILSNPYEGKALRNELKGLMTFRVSHFRIVYRIAGKNIIEIVAIGPRKRIYEETYRIIKREEEKESSISAH